ncbi:MAG: zinc-ribbon domain-containing protein, partial [Pseudohongiellaceae bacterium]
MKNFSCSCGQTLFFENTRCLNCDKPVGFDAGS